MCFRFVACVVALTACSSDVFVSGDSGVLDGGDASVADVSAEVGKPPEGGPNGDGGVKGTIACGSMSCDAKTQICCGAAAWSSESCTSPSGCNSAGSNALACDDQTDCDGELCCATFDGLTSLVTGSSCKGSCDSGDIQLCRSASECSSGNCAALSGKPSGLEKCQP